MATLATVRISLVAENGPICKPRYKAGFDLRRSFRGSVETVNDGWKADLRTGMRTRLEVV